MWDRRYAVKRGLCQRLERPTLLNHAGLALGRDHGLYLCDVMHLKRVGRDVFRCSDCVEWSERAPCAFLKPDAHRPSLHPDKARFLL